MQVQLIDPVGRQYTVESVKAETILLWLAEYIPAMTEGWTIRIWFANEMEARVFGAPYSYQEEWNEVGLRRMENLFKRTRNRLYGKAMKEDEDGKT